MRSDVFPAPPPGPLDRLQATVIGSAANQRRPTAPCERCRARRQDRVEARAKGIDEQKQKRVLAAEAFSKKLAEAEKPKPEALGAHVSPRTPTTTPPRAAAPKPTKSPVPAASAGPAKTVPLARASAATSAAPTGGDVPKSSDTPAAPASADGQSGTQSLAQAAVLRGLGNTPKPMAATTGSPKLGGGGGPSALAKPTVPAVPRLSAAKSTRAVATEREAAVSAVGEAEPASADGNTLPSVEVEADGSAAAPPTRAFSLRGERDHSGTPAAVTVLGVRSCCHSACTPHTCACTCARALPPPPAVPSRPASGACSLCRAAVSSSPLTVLPLPHLHRDWARMCSLAYHARESRAQLALAYAWDPVARAQRTPSRRSTTRRASVARRNRSRMPLRAPKRAALQGGRWRRRCLRTRAATATHPRRVPRSGRRCRPTACLRAQAAKSGSLASWGGAHRRVPIFGSPLLASCKPR